MLKKLPSMEPRTGKDCFIAETAAVIGDVTMGDNCSVWYSAVIRGDVNSIRIGDRVNVQDGTVLHCTSSEKGSITIGDDVVIGHNATVHGADIGSHVLIGMGSTILDGAVIEDGAMVAAHSLILSGTHVGGYELWAGVPAKMVKKVSPELIARTVDKGAEGYVNWAKIYIEDAEDIR